MVGTKYLTAAVETPGYKPASVIYRRIYCKGRSACLNTAHRTLQIYHRSLMCQNYCSSLFYIDDLLNEQEIHIHYCGDVQGQAGRLPMLMNC